MPSHTFNLPPDDPAHDAATAAIAMRLRILSAIHKAMKAQKITAAQLAIRAGIEPGEIDRAIRSGMMACDVEVMGRMCGALGIELQVKK